MSSTISRLRSSNPAAVQADRAETAVARATLERILSEPRPAPRRARGRLRSRLPRGGVAVAIALGLAGGGAAVAATNPFGWWSSNPNAAKYELNPTAHARTPTAFRIGCHALTCTANGRGQLYTKIDTIHQPGPTEVWTRSNLLKATNEELARHGLTAAQAARIRHDIARVSAGFFSEMRVAMRYGAYGGGPSNRVPPRGAPEFLVCEQAGDALSCQNLNGDKQAPIGAGVYMALQAPDWVAAPSQRSDYGLPPGIHFNRAGYRLLIDLSRGTTRSSGGASSRPRQVPAPHS